MKKYAFIVPRYGASIGGGAETLVRELAIQLARRGMHIEVLTTCALDHRTWENSLRPGESLDDGVLVRRFSVDPRDIEKWLPRQINISEGLRLGIDEELAWMENGVNSIELYRYISEHADEFDAMFFAPYLFGTSFWGSLIRPDRSYLIPCLHDENYAYLDLTRVMFREVRGFLFNSKPEMELANRLFGDLNGCEIGMGFEPRDPKSYRSRYFDEDFPYVLYVGRKETGKNVHLLVDYFISSKEMFPELKDLRLVLAGSGDFSDLNRAAALRRKDIIDIGHVSEIDKQKLIGNAVVLCQPSTNESFSIVLMESWLVGTPVLVNASCAVTKHHVIESGGGLYFGNKSEFGMAILTLLQNSNLRGSLSASGKSYTERWYSWEAVVERFSGYMERESWTRSKTKEGNV